MYQTRLDQLIAWKRNNVLRQFQYRSYKHKWEHLTGSRRRKKTTTKDVKYGLSSNDSRYFIYSVYGFPFRCIFPWFPVFSSVLNVLSPVLGPSLVQVTTKGRSLRIESSPLGDIPGLKNLGWASGQPSDSRLPVFWGDSWCARWETQGWSAWASATGSSPNLWPLVSPVALRAPSTSKLCQPHRECFPPTLHG